MEIGYDNNTEEMTIVVILLLFLYKFDDSRIFYKNIFFIRQYNRKRSRRNMRLLSVSGK